MGSTPKNSPFNLKACVIDHISPIQETCYVAIVSMNCWRPPLTDSKMQAPIKDDRNQWKETERNRLSVTYVGILDSHSFAFIKRLKLFFYICVWQNARWHPDTHHRRPAKMANDSKTGHLGDGDNNSRHETIVIVNCVLNAPLMLISIIGNSLVTAAILRTPSLRSPSTIFLCSLAFSDLLVGCVVQPVYITNELTNDSLYKIRNISAFTLCGASLFAITVISVDRFLALHYHMRYPNLMTSHRAIYTSVTMWFVSFLLSFLTFWKISAFYLAVVTSIVISIVISNFCYIKIYRIVRPHQLEIHSQLQAVQRNTENNENMLRSKKTAMNTFIFYIVMILCYTPSFISMSIAAISINSWKNTWILAETISFMNSSINPFLYCWRLRELRTAVVKTGRQMLCKQTEESSL